jgi:branched-chain amino acid aminotransferase
MGGDASVEELIVYAAGEFVPQSVATVPVLDFGFLFGDGVWDGMRVYGGKVFKLEEHLQRLYDLADHCAIEVPMSAAEMKGVIEELLRRNGYPEQAYVRPIVTRGVGPKSPGLVSDECKPSVYVLIHAWQDTLEGAVKLKVSDYRRRSPECLPVAKTLAFMDSTLARIEARRAGADSALLLDAQGNIAEADGSNFFMARDGQLLTPPLGHILPGITRTTAIEITQELGIPVMERSVTPEDAYGADEAFLTSTGAGIVPVASIDGKALRLGAPGPITTQISKQYERMVWG